jgi:iron(III) transport system ATP-binding protein
VTHDQEEALAVSDRIILLDNGRITQAGPPIELYEQPANLFVAGFIGEANLLDAELVAVQGERATVRLGPFTLDVPHRGAVSGPVKLAVRPEAISLHAVSPDEPALAGRILKTAYVGSHFECTVETSLGVLFVIDRAKAQPVPNGSKTWITFAERNVSIVPM